MRVIQCYSMHMPDSTAQNMSLLLLVLFFYHCVTFVTFIPPPPPPHSLPLANPCMLYS